MNTKLALGVGLFALLTVGLVVGGWTVLSDDSVSGSSNIGSLTIHHTHPSPTDSPYLFRTEIHYSLGTSVVEDDSFEDVRFCFYDSDGAVLRNRSLGTFAGSSAYVNLTVETESAPAYVYVHHPRFYDIEGFDIDTMVYQPDRDAFNHVSPDEPPFDARTIDQGSCTPAAS